ncbi:MAG: flagellar basal body-associated FliL family protein [Candidatus Rokubacteria bacterium]|nr:flagellar basal body-associated FliL family protein [Candidatus Rokubacteria bacterium]
MEVQSKGTAQAAAAPATHEVGVPARNPRGRLLMAGAAVLLALATGWATGWWWSAYSPKAHGQAAYRTWRLGSLVVNVARTDGRRYLKTTIEFAMAPGQSEKLLEELRPRLTDTSLGVLANASLTELLDAEQRDSLKERLRDRLNAELKGPVLVRAFFTEFIVQ